MILRRLRMRNFRKYREEAVGFPEGLSAVVGPNGAGKSTLFEAVAWALFGHAMSRTRGYGMTDHGSAEVEVTLEQEGRTYHILRRLTRRGQYTDVRVTDGSTLLGYGDPAVRRILGFDAEVFLRTSYCRQGEMAAVARVRTTSRERLLASLLGLGRLDRVMDLLHVDLQGDREEGPTPAEILAARTDIDQARLRYDEAVRAESAEPQRRRLEDERGRIRGRIGALERAVFPPAAPRPEIFSLRQDLERTTRKIRALQGAAEGRCPLCGGTVQKGQVLGRLRREESIARSRLADLRSRLRADELALLRTRLAETDRKAAELGPPGPPGGKERRERGWREAIAREADLRARHDRAEEARLLRTLAERLGRFRRHVIAESLPKLEAAASAVLEEATGGRYARLRIGADFKIRMEERGSDHVLQRYSGGEQDLAALALRVGMMRLTGGEGLLILDEPFGSQDAERRGSLVGALRNLSRRIPQIIVVTHAEEWVSSFDHVFRIDEEGAISPSTPRASTRSP